MQCAGLESQTPLIFPAQLEPAHSGIIPTVHRHSESAGWDLLPFRLQYLGEYLTNWSWNWYKQVFTAKSWGATGVRSSKVCIQVTITLVCTWEQVENIMSLSMEYLVILCWILSQTKNSYVAKVAGYNIFSLLLFPLTVLLYFSYQ